MDNANPLRRKVIVLERRKFCIIRDRLREASLTKSTQVGSGDTGGLEVGLIPPASLSYHSYQILRFEMNFRGH